MWVHLVFGSKMMKDHPMMKGTLWETFFAPHKKSSFRRTSRRACFREIVLVWYSKRYSKHGRSKYCWRRYRIHHCTLDWKPVLPWSLQTERLWSKSNFENIASYLPLLCQTQRIWRFKFRRHSVRSMWIRIRIEDPTLFCIYCLHAGRTEPNGDFFRLLLW
jgi:hypothetical protein